MFCFFQDVANVSERFTKYFTSPSLAGVRSVEISFDSNTSQVAIGQLRMLCCAEGMQNILAPINSDNKQHIFIHWKSLNAGYAKL